MRGLIFAFALLTVVSCTPSEATPAAPSGPSTQPEAPAQACAPTNMRACFGEMVLLAGRAQIGEKGVDGWQPEFEAAKATQVELSRPHFAMADAAGNIFIADKDADAVRRVASDGVITTVVAAPDVKSPNGLWVGPSGSVYVLDLGHSAIKRIDAEGSVSDLFEIPGGISIGRGLWVASDESEAYVASNTRLLSWHSASGVETIADGFSSLGNLHVSARGELVVTDRGAGRVYRVGADGKKELLAGNGRDGPTPSDGDTALGAALPGVRAIWPERSGGYFLGTHRSSAVWYLDPEMRLHPFLSEPEVNEVRGLSQDAKGNLIVVDDDRGRVWRLGRR